LRERDGRRVALDPASKIVYPILVHDEHHSYGPTSTLSDTVVDCPMSSVTVNTTV
jgi:hypothetical protein